MAMRIGTKLEMTNGRKGVSEGNRPNISVNHVGSKSLKIRFLILLALWFVSFLPVYPGLANTWLNHSDKSHGILVPLISLYFIWRKREKLKRAKISNTNWGVIILAISMGLYLLSYAGGVAVISRSMIVFSLIGLLLFTMGKEVFVLLTFPLLFLIFMVPVPETVPCIAVFPLQLFATKVSSSFIKYVC